MQEWQRIEPTKVHKVGHRTIVTKTFKMPSGKVITWETIHPDGQQFVDILPLTPDGRVIITRVFRAGPEMVMDELPGGFVDAGEPLEQAVRRELLEETGYEPGALEYLGKVHKDVYLNGVWNVFLATNCVLSKQQPAHTEVEEESIEVDFLTIDKLIYNAKHGRMTDHAAILLAYDRLMELKRRGSNAI